MIALVLIPVALLLAFGISGVVDGQLEDEAERIAENNGLADLDPNAPSIFDTAALELGTNEPDVLTGGAGPDILLGLGQTDALNGGAGNDVLDGGTNADTLRGGEGEDILAGGSGADLVIGNAGNDVLLGNAGDDILRGQAGDDLLVGGGDRDELSGGSGNDLLVSGYLTTGESGALDLSGTAAAALRAFGQEISEDTPVEDLVASGIFNGTDIRFLQDEAVPTQGGILNGGSGEDTLILSAGDRATGGGESDTFILNEDMADGQTVFIEDFSSADDLIVMRFDGAAPDIIVRDRGEDAVIFIEDDIIARVLGGAGLQASDIQRVEISS